MWQNINFELSMWHYLRIPYLHPSKVREVANASWLALMAADSTMCCPRADEQQASASSRAGGPTDRPSSWGAKHPTFSPWVPHLPLSSATLIDPDAGWPVLSVKSARKVLPVMGSHVLSTNTPEWSTLSLALSPNVSTHSPAGFSSILD